MKHLDLFSGIGGFALAAERVWPDIEHTFCDNEPFAQAVLSKHWPKAKIYGDIRSLTADAENQRAQGLPMERQQRQKNTDPIQYDLLTGGFPCQPFSNAGRKGGKEDDRYLWPEMLRVIREFKPRWIIGENVAGIVNMVLDEVCADLEAEGYEVQPFVIPAVAVNAPHRRDRVWIVANSIGSFRSRRPTQQRWEEEGGASPGRRDLNASDSKSKFSKRNRKEGNGWGRSTNKSWNKNWIEVAARLCRVDDGVPRRLDRNPRLKALGNSIVPQVAEEIMRAILLIENKP